MFFSVCWCLHAKGQHMEKIPRGELSLRSTSYFCYLATPTLSKAAHTTLIDMRYVFISVMHVCMCTCVITARGADVSALGVRG